VWILERAVLRKGGKDCIISDIAMSKAISAKRSCERSIMLTVVIFKIIIKGELSEEIDGMEKLTLFLTIPSFKAS